MLVLETRSICTLQRWRGKQYILHVQGIVVNGGLAGKPTFYPDAHQHLSRNRTPVVTNMTQIYIANHGGGGVQGSVSQIA